MIGIDPGITGAIAVWSGSLLEVYPMPIVNLKKGKSNRNSVSPSLFSNMLKTVIDSWGSNIYVYIEKVHMMPKMGGVASFSFGMGYGVLLGAISMAGLSYTEVPFKTWHKVMVGIKGKDAARERAANLFPAYRTLFAKKKDDGAADAALIAKYGRKLLIS